MAVGVHSGDSEMDRHLLLAVQEEITWAERLGGKHAEEEVCGGFLGRGNVGTAWEDALDKWSLCIHPPSKEAVA